MTRGENLTDEMTATLMRIQHCNGTTVLGQFLNCVATSDCSKFGTDGDRTEAPSGDEFRHWTF